MPNAPNLKGFIIFLIVAGVIVPLFHRARIGSVLGFLMAGVALGPNGVGRLIPDHPWVHFISFDDPHRAENLAEFGIIIFLFLLGLELSLQRLWELRRYVLGVGLAQVVVTTLVIGFAVRFAGGVRPAGLVLGMCLALSSTAIAMQTLVEQHRSVTLTGRIALSVLLFQDLMVVPILFIVGVLAGGGRSDLAAVTREFIEALAAVAALLIVGRYVLRPLLVFVVRTGARDLIMALALLILVAGAVVTAVAGLSAALGAFLAGLLLSDSEARHSIEIDLEPFKGLLLGIFFITVGTRLDVFAAASDAGWILGGVVLLMAVKAAVLFGVSRLFGVPRPAAAEAALLLSQAGEFAFVVLGVAEAGHLLPPRLAAGAVAVVGLSMLLTPVAALIGRRLSGWLAKSDGAAHTPEAIELEGHVVIGGCGRVGRLIARALAAENVPYVCVDNNGDAVAALRREGLPVYFGDAGRAELLEKIGAERARGFVVTVNNRAAAEHMVTAARQVRPDAPVFARAADAAHAARLIELGAAGVIPETIETSLQLTARLLEGLELPEETVTQRVAELRAAELGQFTGAGG